MNGAADCHEIPDCSGIFVDAFRGSYLSLKTKDPANTFILSHYHGDHYGSLPRGQGGYQGPAKIHCTIVTAELLVRVHGVDKSLVIPHALGETWTTTVRQPNEDLYSGQKPPAAVTNNQHGASTTRITFYDANHCPGAAIILFQAQNGKVHLHTGDMRYHERMKTYPLLREAALQKQIDTVLLDTTYAHPKHSFLPQDEAVDQIATQVVNLLQTDEGQPRTLILLSCYSIGKEKVLWEVAKRTGQRIFANERKRQMLACIQTANNDNEAGDNDKSTTTTNKESDSCVQIINHCTDDPTASNIHIIPMGLAGQMWPFFQPNYKACLEYAQKQTATSKTTDVPQSPYERVVAFLPTGWADASNWNKKNACKTIVMDGVTVSVRLVAYSEHSTHDELQQMVCFLQPRQVIPTVYSDEKDRRNIQARFRVDTRRAKEAFFKSMIIPTRSTKSPNQKSSSESKELPKMLAQDPQSSSAEKEIDVVDLVSDVEFHQTVQSPRRQKRPFASGDVGSLVSMGFSGNDAEDALEATMGDIGAAIDLLLRQPANSTKVVKPTTLATLPRKHRREESSSKSGMKSIKSFFAVKKR